MNNRDHDQNHTLESATDPRQTTLGIVYGLAAYLWWGFCAIYFKAVAHVPAVEVLAHRVIWSVIMLVVILRARGRLPLIRQAFRDRRTRGTLVLCTVLIANNWVIFIWAIANDQIMQASLGYFINPLVNVMLGMIFLRERLRRLQWVSLMLAFAGVLWLAIGGGQFPWIALALAFSFGFYGLLRKTVAADAMIGLTVETMLLAPLAVGYLLVAWQRGQLVFAHHTQSTDLLLLCAGAVTALPLIWFANAARRLSLTAVGFIQYIAPTLQFLLAVCVYGEPFSGTTLVAFCMIWTALLIFTIEAIINPRTHSPTD